MVHSPTRGMWLTMHKQSMWVAHLGSALYKAKQPRKNGLTHGMNTAWGLDWKVNLSHLLFARSKRKPITTATCNNKHGSQQGCYFAIIENRFKRTCLLTSQSVVY